MKVVILLAALTVAAALPEAPLDRRYLPPGRSNGHRRPNGLSQGYQGATTATFGGQNGGDLSQQFAPPSANNGAPSPQYGPPSANNGAPSAKYGPPGYQNGAPIRAAEDPLAEPASYKFSYKVEDAEAGLDFGHQEEREGEEAKGEYRVLLPDGRTMVVTYTANEDGYNPEVKFEEARGGYSRGPNGNGIY